MCILEGCCICGLRELRGDGESFSSRGEEDALSELFGDGVPGSGTLRIGCTWAINDGFGLESNLLTGANWFLILDVFEEFKLGSLVFGLPFGRSCEAIF